MSTAAKVTSRPAGRAEGESEVTIEEKETAAPPVKKTRLVKVSHVFEGPSTDKRYGGNYAEMKHELVLNAKTEGRALLALEKGYAPTWMAPDGVCRPRARNEQTCSIDVTLTTGPTSLREFFADDGKPFAVLSAASRDIIKAAARKAGCSEHFLTGSVQEVSLLGYSVSIPSAVAAGVTVAPLIHKASGEVVTKLKRPTLVVVGRGAGLGRTGSSASGFRVSICSHSVAITCEKCKSGARAEVKHEAPVTTADLGDSIGEGSLQGEFLSGAASGFMQGTVLYARESDADSGGSCTLHKSALRGKLAQLQENKEKMWPIPLRETTAGVAPSLDALLFGEFIHVIYNAAPGSRKLIKNLRDSKTLQYETIDGKKRITAVTVKRTTMIHIVERALKKHTDDEETFTPDDRIGFAVTPVVAGMDKTSLLAWSREQQSAMQKPSVYNPTISVSLTAEIVLKVRSTSSGEGKDSDVEIEEEDIEEEEELETTADAAGHYEQEEEEEAEDTLDFGDE